MWPADACYNLWISDYQVALNINFTFLVLAEGVALGLETRPAPFLQANKYRHFQPIAVKSAVSIGSWQIYHLE